MNFLSQVIQDLDHHFYGIGSASGQHTAEEEDFLAQMLSEEEEKNTIFYPNQEP